MLQMSVFVGLAYVIAGGGVAMLAEKSRLSAHIASSLEDSANIAVVTEALVQTCSERGEIQGRQNKICQKRFRK